VHCINTIQMIHIPKGASVHEREWRPWKALEGRCKDREYDEDKQCPGFTNEITTKSVGCKWHNGQDKVNEGRR